MWMRLLRRARYLLHHRRHAADLEEEMAFHRAMTSGSAFGNATLAREDARGVWIWPWIESTWQDAAYAVRALGRDPAFTLLAVGALTAGIGLNTSLFTVYAAVAMKPWPAREPDRLVTVLNGSADDLRTRAGGGPRGFSQAEIEYFRAHAKTIAGFIMSSRRGGESIGADDARAGWVSANYFSTLGIDMAAGRGFLQEEDRPDSPASVVVLGYAYWQRRFAGDAAIVGRQVYFEDLPFTVVGVSAAGFVGTWPEPVDIWMPLPAAGILRPDDRWVRNVLREPANCCTGVAARLAPGVTREQAAAELSVLRRQFRGNRPTDTGGIEVVGTQLFADPKNDGAATFIPLFAALLIVLLLACANVGNLLLARAASRRREIAVRLSLGASRARVVRQLFTESLVLACMAGVTGVVLAAWLPRQIVNLAVNGETSLRLEPDLGALAFTVALCVLSCLVFGLAPALHGTRTSVVSGLKDGVALPGGRCSLRTLLLSVQVAAVVVLLVAAGVMIGSIRQAAERTLGRATPGLSIVSLELPGRGYDATRTRALSLEIAETLRSGARPGTLAFTSTTPLASGNIKGSFRLPGGHDDQYNAVYEISPEFVAMMRLPIVAGRGLHASDAGHSVILINQTMAERYWPGRSAIGQRILSAPPAGGWNIEGELEIVGVVGDAYMSSVDSVEPTIYQPLSHRTLPQVIASDRTAADLAAAAVARIDARVRVRVQPLSANLAPRVRSTRVAAAIAGILGLIALGFACIGMFGVFAFWVRQRTQEIGIRLALGAQSSDVIGLVMATTARAVAMGVGAGLFASVAVSRLLRGFLFGASGIDPLTYALVAILLVLASLCAAYVPARRATRIDPLVALRYE